MQTFLPYPDFEKSAQVLDMQRLGKQRVEGMQILKVLLGLGKRNKNGNIAWSNHPAVKMWKGSEVYLYEYTLDMCDEWIKRGYKDTVKQKTSDMWMQQMSALPLASKPWWLGKNKFHASHRQTLLEKNYKHYSQFGWIEKAKYEYWWPTEHEDEK